MKLKLIVLITFLFGMSIPTWAQQPEARPPEPEIYQGFDSLIPGLPPEIVRVSFHPDDTGLVEPHPNAPIHISRGSEAEVAEIIRAQTTTTTTQTQTTTISFKIPTVRLQLVLDAFDAHYPGRVERDADGNIIRQVTKLKHFKRQLRRFIADIVTDYVKNGAADLKTLRAQKESEAEAVKTEIEREQQ